MGASAFCFPTERNYNNDNISYTSGIIVSKTWQVKS